MWNNMQFVELEAGRKEKKMQYQEMNAHTIDKWVEGGWEWETPVSHEVFAAAQDGRWDVYLTPTKPVLHRWFGEMKGKKILGLVAGGGQQIPVFVRWARCARCWIIPSGNARVNAWLRRGKAIG